MAFGRITSGAFSGFDARSLINQRMAHLSEQPRGVVMRSPFIHLGSFETAAEHRDRIDDTDDEGNWSRNLNVHQFKFAPYTQLHAGVFTDSAVNLAHASMLHDRGLAIPKSVFNSAMNSGLDKDSVGAVKSILSQNIPVVYENAVEVNHSWNRQDPRRLSVLVPAPQMNLVHPSKQRSIHPSPPLPMDFSMVARPTEQTKSQREQWLEENSEKAPGTRKTVKWKDPDSWEDDDW